MNTLLLLRAIQILLSLLIVASALPFLPVGAWLVRLCDFPRGQIAMLALVLLLAIAWHAAMGDWQPHHTWLAAATTGVLFWQIFFIVPFSPLWQKEIADAPQVDREEVCILVANLCVENTQYEAVQRAIEAVDPDLLLLIELNDAWEKSLTPLKEKLPHNCGIARDEGLGIALWSRWPLSQKEVRHLVSERRASVFVEVEKSDDEVLHFVGVHPTPPGLKDSTGPARRDSRVRDAELLLVAKEISEKQNEAWIVTGDFNDVAWSHTTRLFKRISGLRDPRVGRKLLNTYHAERPLLRYPIDHVFLSPRFGVQKLARIELPGSDHFGIVAVVTPPPREKIEPEASPEDLQEAEALIEEGMQDAEDRDIKAD